MVALVVLAALVAPVVLAEWVALAGWAVPAEVTSGSTIPNIAAAPHTKTVQLRTDSAARRAATLLPTVRLAPANSLVGKAATYPAATPQGPAQATAQEEAV